MRDALLVLGELTLRRWRPSDATALSRAVEESIEHLRPWMPWAIDEPLSHGRRLALLEQWDAEWERGATFAFGLWVGEQVAGGCGLHRRIAAGGLEIGYWVHPRHLRRGYATAAAAALTRYAFELDTIERVEIRNDRANAASARIPQRLGFELVGEVLHPPVAPAESGVRQLWRMDAPRWAERSG